MEQNQEQNAAKVFDRQKFNVEFDAAIAELQASEQITKRVLSALSRVLLEQMHFDGDIQPINRLLGVLTPMNRKTCVLFFQHFSGHHYSEKDEAFGKRDKPAYEKKQALAVEFLEDPHNNIWTWAAIHVEMEAKPFTLLKVTKQVESLLKKADKAGFKQEDVFKAMIAGGLDVELVSAILEGMEEA